MKSYKIKYLDGLTTLNYKMATMVVDGDNVRVTVDAHKNFPESVLFDAKASSISEWGVDSKAVKLGNSLPRGAMKLDYDDSQITLIVDGKKYNFFNGVGNYWSFKSNIFEITSALATAGTNVRDRNISNSLGHKKRSSMIAYSILALFILFIIAQITLKIYHSHK